MFTFKFKHLLLLAFFVRLMLVPFFSDDFNLWASITFSNFLIDGYNPWTITYNDPCLHWINPWRCPPLQLLILLPATVINSLYENYILVLYAAKLPLIFADIITLFFLYKTLRLLHKSEKRALYYSLMFALNPITLSASTVGGPSTDSFPVMLSIISFYYFLKSNGDDAGDMKISAFFLGLAAAAKFYPLFLIPVFLIRLKNYTRRIIFFFISISSFLVFNLPFLVWDFDSYVNMLLLHNISGYHPAISFFNVRVNIFLRILAILLCIVMFTISYCYVRKVHILTSIVLTFLAVYVLMGFGLFDTRYFAWFIPFTILLVSCQSVKMKGKSFLPFIFLPSLVVFCIYNGPHDAVEGRTGFFYFLYHWLRQKIVVFKVLPYSDLIRMLMNALSIFLVLYYFSAITIKAHLFEFSKIRNEKLNVLQILNKNKKILVFSIALTLAYLTISVNIVPYESNHERVYVENSKLHFYDDFSCSTLNYQWSVVGNGKYMIKNSSFIVINGNLTLYRGWGPIWRGFESSRNATVMVRFKFESLPQNTTMVPIINTNGGWFGVAKSSEGEEFIYFDKKGNMSYLIAKADENWHIINITYLENQRLIYYDNETPILLSAEKFNYLVLGLPINCNMHGGKFSVDYVKVFVRDFKVGQHSKFYASLSLLVPVLTTIFALIIAAKRKSQELEKI